MPVVHPNAAGIDIGSQFHVVAVSPDREVKPVRTFKSFTGELHAMAQWLQLCGIETIAMESTGVYWIPAYEILESYGFEVFLVNAREAKMCRDGKPISTTLNGYRSCISSVFYVQASDQPAKLSS